MLPDCPGTYVIVLRLPHPARIRVGRLGCFDFPAGWYAYAGSARGPGGLRARLLRHLRPEKVLHWHIDFLRARAQPVEVWHSQGGLRRECAWARALLLLEGASVPAMGFGASDCRCTAHLVHLRACPAACLFAKLTGDALDVRTLDGRPAGKVGQALQQPATGLAAE
jgi:Uri superfamily endonuclease